MNTVKNVLCVILCVAAPLSPVSGQTSPGKTPPTFQPAELKREISPAHDPQVQKVLLVLNQVLEAQKGFADNKLRIALRLQLGDMLWAYDEASARRLFEEGLNALAAADLAERTAATSSSRPSSLISLSFSSIRTVIRRDPALAAKLGDSLVDFPPMPIAISPNYDLRYVLASLLAWENPRRAAEVAKPFADRAELNKLIHIIRGIRRKDARAADELFLQVFEKAKIGEPSVNDIRLLASYVFPGFGEGVISFTSGGGEHGPQTIQLRAEVVKQFLDLAYNTVPARLEQSLTNAGGDPSFLRFPRDYAIATLLGPKFDQFSPDRAPDFRVRLESIRRRVPSEREINMTLHEPGTTNELLARADALSDTSQRDRLYQRAAEQATVSGEIGQATEIVEKIASDSIRSNQRQRISDDGLDEIRKTMLAGDFDKAEKMIGLMSYASSRLWMLRSLIAGVFKKDQPRALRMLEEERGRAERIENRFEKAQELLMLTGVVAALDMNRAFEAMVMGVEEFNQAGFTGEWERYVANERSLPGSNSIPRINVGLSSLNVSDFETLGRSDFERALGIAQQMQPREASALALLALCRGALSKLRPVVTPKQIAPKQQQGK